MLRSLALTSLFAFVAQHLAWSRLSLDFSDLSLDLASDEILGQLCDRNDS